MKRFWMNEAGQGMLTYGLILALVAFVVEIGVIGVSGKMASALASAETRQRMVS